MNKITCANCHKQKVRTEWICADCYEEHKRNLAYPSKKGSKPKICDKHRRIGANAYVVSNTVEGKKFYCVDCFVNEIIKRERDAFKKVIKRMIEITEELGFDNADDEAYRRGLDDILYVIKEWERSED